MADILSQEEIDSLLGVLDDEIYGSTNSTNSTNSTKETKAYKECEYYRPRQVTLYDFKRPNRVKRGQLRSIRGIHDKFSRKLAEILSTELRTIVEVQLHSVDQMTYGEFLMSLPNPTSFNVFSLEPMESNGVFEINNSIYYPILDRLLGGTGEPFEETRELTAIEKGLVKPLLDEMISELGGCWSHICDMNPELLKQESSPNVVQIVAQNEIVVMAVMEVIVGHSSGMLNICYPALALDPYLEKMSKSDMMIDEIEIKQTNNLVKNVEEANIILEICLNEGIETKSLQDINDLKVGDYIKMDKELSIKISDKTYFKGCLGDNRLTIVGEEKCRK